ncbi:hypothetical protein [Pseudohoeflea coraliihabitans]|uniref:Uncharacterized protein n=1 Tax=Pseudohoeflea coraliihabitans TaxID=2860393 RepID=A0ABS6WPP5_9HYPH|nr:hypothetical protein [Pseudohoeflea sp. DP4N28-3]MBW3097885.1 hypothetical protein [Pseudohoeflea sp. DP4N28-3]
MTYSTQLPTEELDDLIVQEKMQVALEYQNDAWADGAAEGIEPEILADAAMTMALSETVRLLGEERAEELISALRERILAGEFSPNRTLQ